MYALSKYMNTIKRIENIEKFKKSLFWDSSYTLHETYEESKQFCIQRAKNKIKHLESEIKKLKKKLPKLEAMTEPKSTQIKQHEQRTS